MQQSLSLQFLTLAFTPFSICIACLLSAAIAGFAVWFAYRNTAKKIARVNEKSKKKLEFLTYLLHELRTPVTMILTPLQKLTANRYDEDTDSELQSMQKNAVKVVSLLDKSMNVDRIVDDGNDMKFREINFIKYLYNLLSIFRYQSRMANVEMSFHSDQDSLPIWVDRTRFDEVLMNLISLVLKNTYSGGTVDLDATSDGKYAYINIKNTGNSFSDDYLTHLFDLYRRADAAGASSENNVELFLCKEIVNQHKGTIKIVNRQDCDGIRITIQMPLGNSHIPKHRLTSRANLLDETWNFVNSGNKSEEENDGATETSPRKYSIFAIDEYPDICRYLQTLLSPNFNVTTFTSPNEGLQAAITDTPDLVIAEVMMSDMDGITLVKRLKSNSNTAHIPVLLLTALPGEEVRVQGLLTGADAIISKPFNEEELILNCNNLIKSRSRLASHIKEMQITKDNLHPIELQSNNDLLMQKVIETINERISDPELNVEILADAIGISRGHLHRKIKEITGSSPGEYIRSIRLNQAAQLLRGEKKNISQISYSVGYSNPSVFSTAFRQFFGMSAKDYQKRYSGSEEPESGRQQPQPKPQQSNS